MKPPFKVGERVAVYTTYGRKTGKVTKIEDIRNKYDKESERMLVVKHDGSNAEYRQHPKQCRRLKKKERRKVWIAFPHEESRFAVTYFNEIPDIKEECGQLFIRDLSRADSWLPIKELIPFVEVRRGK